MKKLTVVQVCFIALSAVINIIGGNLALVLRLPIYLDSYRDIFWHRRCLVPGWRSSCRGGSAV